jgi:hypothetical protein
MFNVSRALLWKPVTSKWHETYLTHYKRVKEDLTVTDAKEIEKYSMLRKGYALYENRLQVNDSIRKDLIAGLLDINVAAAS